MRDRNILPIDESGNGERIKSLSFDFADAAMLYHAVLIGGNTVMMGNGGKALQRMRYYEEKFREACPPGYKHFRREEDIANIAIAMMDAEKCHVIRTRRYSDSTEGELKIKAGKVAISTFVLKNEFLEEAIECLRLICPITCEIEIEDVIERGW